MTDRLAEIAARAEAATEGPWELADDYGPNFYAYLGGEYLQGVGDFNFGEGDQANADRALVLNASADIKYLLAEIAQLAAENAILERSLGLNEGAAA